MTRRHARLAAALLALAAARPAAAQGGVAPGELSLERAVAAAVAGNPDLLAQRNDVEVANAAVKAAVGDYLPTLTAGMGFGYTAPGERRSGSVVLAQQPSVYSSNYSVSAGYSFAGARLYGTGSARDDRRATVARLSGAQAALVSDVTQRYVAALGAAEEVELAGAELARTAEHLRTARDRLAAGQVTTLDVRHAEVQAGRAELRRSKARSAYAAALLSLGTAMGQRLDPAVRLTSRVEPFEPRWDADELVRRAVQANPALLAARASAHAAGSRVKVARAAYLPTLALSLSFTGWKQMSDEDALIAQRLGSGPQDSATVSRVRQEVRAQNRGFPFGYNRQPLAASLNVQLPVFSGFGRAQQVQQARAAAQDAGLQVRAQELRVDEEVRTALLDMRSAYEGAGVAERVRAAAEEELAMERERFRLGMANSLVVLDAESQLSQAEQEKADAAFAFRRALARLEAVVGEPLR